MDEIKIGKKTFSVNCSFKNLDRGDEWDTIESVLGPDAFFEITSMSLPYETIKHIAQLSREANEKLIGVRGNEALAQINKLIAHHLLDSNTMPNVLLVGEDVLNYIVACYPLWSSELRDRRKFLWMDVCHAPDGMIGVGYADLKPVSWANKEV